MRRKQSEEAKKLQEENDKRFQIRLKWIETMKKEIVIEEVKLS